MIANPTVRKWLYIVSPTVSALLLILVAAGAIDEGTSASIANAVASLLAIATGGVAVSHLSPKPATIGADGVAVITEALDAYARQAAPVALETTAGAAASVVDQMRAELERRLSR